MPCGRMGVSRAQLRAPQALPSNAGYDGRRFCAAFGRRVSAGHEPDAGAYAAAPAWWGRDHWLGVEVATAVALHRDECRAEHVDPATARRVAAAHARFADHRTGRRCRPTNERLAADLGCSTRTVQRARRLLKRLGLIVEVVRGRSIMSRAERLAAWRRGSSHRRLAAEFALCSRRVTYPQPGRSPVERVTPPREARGVSFRSRDMNSSSGQRPREEARRSAPGSPPRAGSGERPRSAGEVRARRLIAGVQARLGWLSRVSPRRLTSLHRFARQGWTPRDVHQALDEVLTARGWRVPDRLDQPAAYLAALLRDVDEHDRPGALEEAMLAEERARREWIWATKWSDRECEHGQPAGDLPHPVDGHLSCPLCRRAGAATISA